MGRSRGLGPRSTGELGVGFVAPTLPILLVLCALLLSMALTFGTSFGSHVVTIRAPTTWSPSLTPSTVFSDAQRRDLEVAATSSAKLSAQASKKKTGPSKRASYSFHLSLDRLIFYFGPNQANQESYDLVLRVGDELERLKLKEATLSTFSPHEVVFNLEHLLPKIVSNPLLRDLLSSGREHKNPETLFLRATADAEGLALKLEGSLPEFFELTHLAPPFTFEMRAHSEVSEIFVPKVGNIFDESELHIDSVFYKASKNAPSTVGVRAVSALPSASSEDPNPLQLIYQGQKHHGSKKSPLHLGLSAPFGLRFLAAQDSFLLWETYFRSLKRPAKLVYGAIKTASPEINPHIEAKAEKNAAQKISAPGVSETHRTKKKWRIYGYNDQGKCMQYADVYPDLSFAFLAPDGINTYQVQWEADSFLFTGSSASSPLSAPSFDSVLSSEPLRFQPGSFGPLLFYMQPAGKLKIKVVDPDRSQKLTARILVRGVEGSIDPSFGPDFRAKGAGPLFDALEEEAVLSLTPGRYQVMATKGPEWSIDAATVRIDSGQETELTLYPRHVVSTPNFAACDLHVHAKPSFDSEVTVQDRIFSLVAAGIDFAVPTEHNHVGDYHEELEQGHLPHLPLQSVNGVEITTLRPALGHFGIFPYPKNAKPPPFEQTNLNEIFTKAKEGDPNRILVIHHPHLKPNMGYFDLHAYDAKTHSGSERLRFDFDAIEVMNGYEISSLEPTLQTLHDWLHLIQRGYRYVATGSSDSHRILFNWAGYPRSYVQYTNNSKKTDTLLESDIPELLKNLKVGHSFVTTGPILDLDVSGLAPGDTLEGYHRVVMAHLKVRAAPWIDVNKVWVLAGGREVKHVSFQSRKTEIGPVSGSLDSAQESSIRFDETFQIELSPQDRSLVFVAQGDENIGTYLFGMSAIPFAFTNPIFLNPF